MELATARKLARKLMDRHHLKDWWCCFNSRFSSFHGRCQRKDRTIELGKAFVELNTDYEVKKLILHEMAHAITSDGHTTKFYECLADLFKKEGVADNPQRVYSVHRRDKCVEPPRKPRTVAWQCPNCGKKRYELVGIPPCFKYEWGTDEAGQIFHITTAYRTLADLIGFWRDNQQVNGIKTRQYSNCWQCKTPMVLTKNGEPVRKLNFKPEMPVHPEGGCFED